MTNNLSPIFQIAHDYVEQSTRLSPIASTYFGITDYDNVLDDFHLESSRKGTELSRQTLERLKELEPTNEHDRIAKKIMIEDLEHSLVCEERKDGYALWGVIDSPVSSIRSVFEVMPYETDKDINNIIERMVAVNMAYRTWTWAIQDLADMNIFTPVRHVLGVAKQLDEYANGTYRDLALRFDPDKKYPLLHKVAMGADTECAWLAKWLRQQYTPVTITRDPVGEERYLFWAESYTGTKINPREVYKFGVSELEKINSRMWEIANDMYPNSLSLRDVADKLNKNEKYLIQGEKNLLDFLRNVTDEATKSLDGIYFDIDEKIKLCEVRLAPEGGDAAPYYMPPTEDLSRPGTTWFPTLGKTEFPIWQQVSTWYHESVPGHHLQIGTTAVNNTTLSRYQKEDAWNSGYGEGWALYAETFMYEQGYFTDPGYEMGYLACQALRAARLVVDIGLHLEYKDLDGNVWNAKSAVKLLTDKALLGQQEAESEVDRYLCWPGQAISYKVGEQVWLQIREDAKKRLGDKFSIKNFHNYALNLGPMGLGMLKEEMTRWDGN